MAAIGWLGSQKPGVVCVVTSALRGWAALAEILWQGMIGIVFAAYT